MRDAFSRFVLLIDCATCDTEAAVEGLLEWIALFGIPERFFSDQGPHFRNKVMQQLAKKLNVIHDFSTPYCAWSNGLIERVLRDITALFKIMLVENRIDKENWKMLVPHIQMALNQRPSRSLGNHCPIKVHTGIAPTNLLNFYVTGKKLQDMKWSRNINQHIEMLSRTLDEIHVKVYQATQKITEASRKNAKDRFHYEIGDFVLYTLVDRVKNMQKLNYKWVGPFQIVDTRSEFVFHIKDLIQGKIMEAHVDRLSFYSNKLLKVSGDLKELISRQGQEWEISAFLDIIWDVKKKMHLVHTKWAGLNTVEATFEPFNNLLEQVPLFLLKFMNELNLKDENKVKKIFEYERENILRCIRHKHYEISSFNFIK
jgi:Integrase core domain